MMFVIPLVINIFGLILALFIFWRKLKEDYIANQIFSVWFMAFFIFIIFIIIAKYFFPNFIFWVPFITSFISVVIYSKKLGMRSFEVIEASVISYIGWFLFYSIGLAILSKTTPSLLLMVTNLIAFLGFFVIDTQYKKITWYKSGRTGFTGMFTMGLYFLVRAAIALIAPSMLIFLLEYDIFMSGVISFISFLMIFNLARYE